MIEKTKARKGKKRRVHSSCQDGTCQQEPFVIDDATGKLEPYPVTNPVKMSPQFVQQKGGVIIDKQTIQQAKNNKTMASNNMPYGVEDAETVEGAMDVVRIELPGANSGSNTLTFSIDNGETDAQEILLGDGYGLLDNAFNVGSKAASVTLGGSFGANTKTLVDNQCSGGAIRLHGIHIVNTNSGSDSTDFFDSGKLELCKASPINNTNERNRFDFSLLVSGETFKPSIRENKNFRFLLSGYTGLLFTVPAGEKVVMTFTVASVADGYNMSRMPG